MTNQSARVDPTTQLQRKFRWDQARRPESFSRGRWAFPKPVRPPAVEERPVPAFGTGLLSIWRASSSSRGLFRALGNRLITIPIRGLELRVFVVDRFQNIHNDPACDGGGRLKERLAFLRGASLPNNGTRLVHLQKRLIHEPGNLRRRIPVGNSGFYSRDRFAHREEPASPCAVNGRRCRLFES